MILQPVEDPPASSRPGGTDAPASEHIDGIVDTKVDATDADSDGKEEASKRSRSFALRPASWHPLPGGPESTRAWLPDCCFALGSTNGN